MKKTLLMLSLVMIFVLAGCTVEKDSEQNQENQTEDVVEDVAEDVIEENNSEMTMEEILDAMYAQLDVEWPKFVKQPLTEENMEYMLGVTNFEFIEGVVSEPMMTSQAHSIVLFTVNESADIETIKADIKANVDGRKWICVEVADENILVDHVGNYVVLIMDNNSRDLMSAFKEIME